MAKKKEQTVPPSLLPRSKAKKTIPGSGDSLQAKTVLEEKKKASTVKKKVITKVEKERITLWIDQNVYKALELEMATRKGNGIKGSRSDYIEGLIKKELNIK